MSCTDLLRCCAFLEDGFAAIRTSDAWRLGAVLLARHGDRFCLVRKAKKADYAFSAMWSLPGGMVRSSHSRGEGGRFDNRMVRKSLEVRVLAEAGIAATDCTHWQAEDGIGPIVTHYRAAGQDRYTLVAVQSCHVGEPHDVGGSDAPTSIDAVVWTDIDSISWDRVAPANRVILAHLLWATLGDGLRERAAGAVSEALRNCSYWNAHCGFAAIPAPWSDPVLLTSWRSSWSIVR